MRRKMFQSKIHRAIITQADLEYEGSVTIDSTLLEAAGILENEAIQIWNITSGTRLETYVLEGERDSGEICINGAAAHLNKPGDMVILATFVELDDAEARNHEPTVVRVDGDNKIVSLTPERAGPQAPVKIA